MEASISDQPVFALIGERYLDTQHDGEYIAKVEAELKRRGIVGAKRAALEYLAASGLWWNLFWWEWVSLGARAVLVGWISNLVLFALAGIAAGYWGGLAVAAAGVLALHALTLWIGLDLRRGTRSDAKLQK